jgi:peptidoglycan hydrolase-like protein with peptidoglycan-binding domain
VRVSLIRLILESRAATGLAAPKQVGTNITPQRGGIAIHWAGEHQGIITSTPHTTCHSRLRAWQMFHMYIRGWNDLAYNWVVCQHGIVMVGRGWGVRSAANGTNDGNQRYLAACWMGGQGDAAPSSSVLTAFESLIAEVRTRGAGLDVQPHRHFFSTDCPGNALAALTDLWRRMKIATPGARSVAAPPFPLPAGWYFGPRSGPPQSVSGYVNPYHRRMLAIWQVRADLTGDGLYGPRTAARARALQTTRHLDVDGLIGPLTWRAAWN